MNILILGGTTGIGWALAQHYLAAGHSVTICGRHLQKVPSDISLLYPALHMHSLDIADRPAVHALIAGFAEQPLDLMIVAAGFYFNTRHHPLDKATTLRMLQTNVCGLSHAFEMAAQIMLKQGSGQLVAIASVAGLLKDYPGASLYSASKRSVLSLCATYRIALAPFSIAVTAIVPGYVDTEKLRKLNGGDARHKPYIISEQEAVAHIMKAVASRQAVCVFPWQMRCLIALLNILPAWILTFRP